MPPSQGKLVSPRRLKVRWSLPDLIDFEYLLESDRDKETSGLVERDHDLYRRVIKESRQEGGHEPAWNRRWLFYRWLELRRETVGRDRSLPGGVFQSAWRLINEILAVLGVLAGAGMAGSLLHYDGVQPVNVAVFLGWLVVAQVGLVLGAGGIFLLRRFGCLFTEIAVLTGSMRWLWSWLAGLLSRNVMDRVPAERRMEMKAFFGRVAGRNSMFGEVALWPLAGTLQWFGVCFNVGALVATFLLVVFSDRAFGWQSAAELNATQVHAVTQWMASPWTWFYPEGAPTFNEIMGSKIILKDGIRQLATENLVSWWPFLCLSLVVYGWLPRMVLWGLAFALGYQARRQVTFRHVLCDRLYERMTMPSFRTCADTSEESSGKSRIQSPSVLDDKDTFAAVPDPQDGIPVMLLLSEDFSESLGSDVTVWCERLAGKVVWKPCRVTVWPAATHAQEQALSRIASWSQDTSEDHSSPVILWLEEAWQPPIAEKLQMFRDLRQCLGGEARLIVLLIGRPQGHDPFASPSAAEFRVWKDHLAGLGDPALRVEAWRDA